MYPMEHIDRIIGKTHPCIQCPIKSNCMRYCKDYRAYIRYAWPALCKHIKGETEEEIKAWVNDKATLRF